MKRKINDLELKLYELLGVKQFKKFVLGMNDVLVNIKFRKDPESKEKFKKRNTNYNIGSGKTLDDLRRHKEGLIFNTVVHINPIIYCVPTILSLVGLPIVPIVPISAAIIAIAVNGYCVMLQRYNWIRINRVIEKFKPLEEKKITKTKEEVKEIDKDLSEHTYTATKTFNRKKELSLDEVIEKASLEQLKEYRNKLLEAEEMSLLNSNTSTTNEPIQVTLPSTKYKSLKLEFKPNNSQTTQKLSA